MLAALRQGPADARAFAALDSTFGQRAYDRSIRATLWRRIMDWIGAQLDKLFEAARHSPGTARAVVVLLVLVSAAIVSRALYLRWQRRELAPTRRGARGAAGDDPWSAAAALAAGGDHTAAAHALYAALLARLARRERLRRHPSKTAGEYVRELRALASPAHAPFRAFARDYDVVVYGIGTCDATRYGRLLGLADGVLQAVQVPERARA